MGNKRFKQTTAPGRNMWSGWEYPVHRQYKLCCCDCGIVHNMNFQINRQRQVGFQVQINRRSTAAVRRQDRREKSKSFLSFARRMLVETFADHPEVTDKFVKNLAKDIQKRTRQKRVKR